LVGQTPTTNARSGNLTTITTIYGDGANNINYHENSGVRLSGGLWLDENRTYGLDASYFQLEHKTKGSIITSPGDPVIGPTFFDPVTGHETIVLASLPTFTSGLNAFAPRAAVISIQNNERLYGAEINARYQIGAWLMMDRLDFFAGFRHLYFGEGLDITTESIAQPGNLGPNVLASDHFGTRNQFWGGQFGFASHAQCGRLSFDGILKIGLGDVHEVVDINGSTTIGATTIGGVTTPQTTSVGGILAEPTNIGHHNRDQFAVLPELTFTLGYQVAEHVRATIGYNFLYLSRVLRAGDQIDGVDARQVRSLNTFTPGAQVTFPQPVFFTEHFYAQGLNFGLEVSY
jgi:hypothetical protein